MEPKNTHQHRQPPPCKYLPNGMLKQASKATAYQELISKYEHSGKHPMP